MSDKYFDGFSIYGSARSLEEYEFTRRAIFNMNKVLDSEQFAEMEAHEIYNFLSDTVIVVQFGDHLKRYLYELAEIDESFDSVPDSVYVDIIKTSFKENRVPYSFEETKISPGVAIKRWLNQSTVSRDVVFLLGFGLRMPDTDVEEFLQKYIQEFSFDFLNPREVIFWYCFHRNLTYGKAVEYIEVYEKLDPEQELNKKLWSTMESSPKLYLTGEERLILYLSHLKQYLRTTNRHEVIRSEFLELYDRASQVLNRIVYDGSHETIQPSDFEHVLCSGIPVTANGNLMKVSESSLSKQVGKQRMTRQRIQSILKGGTQPNRFDFITMLFYIYAEDVEPDWPTERYMKYIDEINTILGKCGMQDIYPVNPYESFVLMCLLAEFPLDTYAEVWEYAFSE